MLIVRFSETFRERAPEWILAAGLLLWSLVLLSSDGMFERNGAPDGILTRQAFALTGLALGATRLIFLFINGAWRPSAHLRAIGCGVACLFWMALAIGALGAEWRSPTVAAYLILLAMDGLSLYFAAGDAARADCAARRRKRAGDAVDGHV